MEISGLQVIIQASGKISLEKICGQEIIVYLTKVCQSLSCTTTVIADVAVEQMRQIMKQYHKDEVRYVMRDAQTAAHDALITALSGSSVNTVLICNGNMPCINTELITNLYTKHIQEKSVVSIAVPDSKKDGGYCSDSAALLIVQRYFLEKWLSDARQNSTKQEFHSIDLARSALNEQQRVAFIPVSSDTICTVNTMQELYELERMKRLALITYWMNNDVRFACMNTVYIDITVAIGPGTYIAAGVHLLGNTVLGKQCYIHAYSILDQVTMGDNAIIYSHSVIKKSTIGKHAHIGPFAHVHDDNTIGDQSIIGNFIEMKRSSIGAKAKAKHLSYLGDASVGDAVNIGAGSITCNHDGFTKHTTTIEHNAYVGTNTILVAPVTIGHDAFIAAGSTITKDVPSYALAIARTRQINKDGYVHLLREKKRQKVANKNGISQEENNAHESFIGAVKTEPKIIPTDSI